MFGVAGGQVTPLFEPVEHRPPRGPWIAMASRADRDACPEELDSQLASPFPACCADRTWWTLTIAVTAVHTRAPGSWPGRQAGIVPSCRIRATPSNYVQMSVTRPS